VTGKCLVIWIAELGFDTADNFDDSRPFDSVPNLFVAYGVKNQESTTRRLDEHRFGGTGLPQETDIERHNRFAIGGHGDLPQ